MYKSLEAQLSPFSHNQLDTFVQGYLAIQSLIHPVKDWHEVIDVYKST